MAIQFDNTNTGTATLKPAASGSVALTLPGADGTNGQVIQTDGSGQLSFATVSGGSSTLGGLTDVTITSVVDGDLLRYNGTASEWQNTNLGISIAPTISYPAGTVYENFPVSFTITNHSSYDNPTYFFQIKSGATVIVDNDSFSVNGDTVTFNAPSNGTYTLESRVQDFGDLASEVTSTSITITTLPAFRYYRLTFVASSSSNYLRDFRVYTGSGQTGTAYPPNMTSNTAPSPYVASGSGSYSTTYDPFKAFDNSPTGSGWWNLSQTPYTTAWVQIDLGSAVAISSVSFAMNVVYQTYSSVKISGSNTGAFSGEEIDITSTTEKSDVVNIG